MAQSGSRIIGSKQKADYHLILDVIIPKTCAKQLRNRWSENFLGNIEGLS